MFKPQASLGDMKPLKTERYTHLKIAKVVGVEDWEEDKKIDVIFNGGKFSGGVVTIRIAENGTQIEPEENDIIVVGFINGNKNDVFLLSYVTDKYKYANRIKINEDGVKIRWLIVAGEEYDPRKDGTDDEQDGDEVYILLKPNGEIEIESDGNDVSFNVKDILMTCEKLQIISGLLSIPSYPDVKDTLDDIIERIVALEAVAHSH